MAACWACLAAIGGSETSESENENENEEGMWTVYRLDSSAAIARVMGSVVIEISKSPDR